MLKTHHQPAQEIIRLQAILSVKLIHYKLKYLRFFEHTHVSELVYGISIGPRSVITKKAFFEVS